MVVFWVVFGIGDVFLVVFLGVWGFWKEKRRGKTHVMCIFWLLFFGFGGFWKENVSFSFFYIKGFNNGFFGVCIFGCFLCFLGLGGEKRCDVFLFLGFCLMVLRFFGFLWEIFDSLLGSSI